MHKRFILILVASVASLMPTKAQTPAPQIIQTQEQFTSLIPLVTTAPAPLLSASLLRSEDPIKFPTHFSYRFAGAYDHDQSLQSFLSLHQVKTLFLTQSSLTILQFWGGRLRLDGFRSTLRMQTGQFGPFAAGSLQDFRPSRQSYTGEARLVSLTGLSLNFRFGRNGEIPRLTQICGHVARFVAAAR